MKTKLTKLLLLTLVIVLAVVCFVSCKKDNTHVVTVMDGETEVTTFEVPDGETLNADDVAEKLAKTGYDLNGLFSDPELTEVFALENEITADMTLYAKYSAKTLYISYKKADGTTEKVAVTKGGAYTLTPPTKEGYDFDGFTYENDDEEEVAFATSGTYAFDGSVRLTAKWKLKEYTVTYKNGTADLDTEKVKHGEKATGIDEIAGYTIEGYYLDAEMTADKKFTLKRDVVTANTDLYVKLVPNVYTITVVGYSAANCEVAYGATYTLPTKEALEEAKAGEWASFDGYKFGAADGEAFAQTGTFTWTQNIIVYATYTRDPMYLKSTVTFMDGGTHKGDVVVNDGEKVTAAQLAGIETAKTGYDFNGWFKNAGFTAQFDADVDVITTDLTLFAKYTAHQWTIYYGEYEMVVTYGQSFTMPDDLTAPGYTFGGYTYNDQLFPDEDSYTGTYLYDNDITVTIVWTIEEGNDFVPVPEEVYFKERASATDPYTFVFLVGNTYDFNGKTVVTEANNVTLLAGATSFEVKAPGEFTMTVGGKTINAKAVYNVTALQLGNDYNAMIANVNNGVLFQGALASANDYVMTIGRTNFIPDLTIQNAQNNAISLADANMTVAMTVGGDAVNADFAVDANGAFTFNNNNYTTMGNIVLTFTPKYVFTNKAVSLTVNMNNGTNVYDNAQLKAAYGDTANHNVVINVLRQIKAELEADDYVAGKGKNIGNLVVKKDGNNQTISDVDLGTPKNMFWEGVYKRTTTGDANHNDSVVINGNFFTVDGSKLPYIADTVNRTEGNAPYVLGNVQIGIFLYRCAELNDPGAYDDMSGLKWNTGNVQMNNLRLVGNNYPEFAGATVDYQDGNTTKEFLKMSSSYDGIIIRGGTLNADNVTITNMNLGFMLHGSISGAWKPTALVANEQHATRLNMTNSIIDNCWCNSIYSYDLVAIDLKNTKVGACSGGAMHFDDRPYVVPDSTNEAYQQSQGVSKLNSSLKMDMYTAASINNWVIGDEPWFTAYAKQSLAAQLKTEMQAGVAALKLSVLKQTTSGEKINLAIIVFPTGEDNEAAWSSDISGGAAIDASVDDVSVTGDMGAQLLDANAGLGTIKFFYGDATEKATVDAALTGMASMPYLGGLYQNMVANSLPAVPGSYVGSDADYVTQEEVRALYQASVGAFPGAAAQAGTPYVVASKGGMQIFIPAFEKPADPEE